MLVILVLIVCTIKLTVSLEFRELEPILMKCIRNLTNNLKVPNSIPKNGIFRSRIFTNFESPLQSFPIAPVHGILGLREKLLDIIPLKILGKDEYKRFEESFIAPLVSPRQQYHGGTYTGDISKKLRNFLLLVPSYLFYRLQVS